MSSHNRIDRWLRFAPWVAALFAACCLVALVARLVLDHSRSSADNLDVESVAESSQLPSATNRSVAQAPPANGQPPEAGNGQSDRTSYLAETTRPTIASGARTARVPDHPVQTRLAAPNSKSRISVYGAATGASSASIKPAGAARGIKSSASAPIDRPSSLQPAAASENVLARIDQHLAVQNSATTSFFGIEANGRRFVYVLDRSLSMGEAGNKPLRAAKAELIKSLERLNDLQQFVVIFYNQDPNVFAGEAPGRLPFATDLNKAQARNFIENISAQGGTRHYGALAKALNLNADVVYLLTDGEPKDDLAADELAELRRMNRSGAQIHVVQFASSPYSSNSLVRLAGENRGQHIYLDIRNSKNLAVER